MTALQSYLARLTELAKAATPGKRRQREDSDYYQGGTYVGVGRAYDYVRGQKIWVENLPQDFAGYFERDICRMHGSDADTAFTLALDPDAVLALVAAVQALEFYAKGGSDWDSWDSPEGYRREFGCSCCAGTVRNGELGYDSDVQGLTAREALADLTRIAQEREGS